MLQNAMTSRPKPMARREKNAMVAGLAGLLLSVFSAGCMGPEGACEATIDSLGGSYWCRITSQRDCEDEYYVDGGETEFWPGFTCPELGYGNYDEGGDEWIAGSSDSQPGACGAWGDRSASCDAFTPADGSTNSGSVNSSSGNVDPGHNQQTSNGTPLNDPPVAIDIVVVNTTSCSDMKVSVGPGSQSGPLGYSNHSRFTATGDPGAGCASIPSGGSVFRSTLSLRLNDWACADISEFGDCFPIADFPAICSGVEPDQLQDRCVRIQF